MTALTALFCGLAFAGSALANIEFTGIPVAAGLDRHNVITSPSAYVDGVQVETGYTTIMRTGDILGTRAFGHQHDKDGTDIGVVSNVPDFASLITTGTTIVWSITHFEAPTSASAYFSKLHQDPETGALTAMWTKPLDFSRYNGLLNPCAGSVTPWNTHLGSEEQDPDGRAFNTLIKAYQAAPSEAGRAAIVASSNVLAYLAYTKSPNAANPSAVTVEEVLAAYNPYMYGYIWEVTVNNAKETAKVVKHFAMGRVSSEMALVMPDQKTVYIADDGNNRGFTMFVATKAGDLSAGTLYAAKVTQTGTENGGSFDVEWINMGFSTDKRCELLARTTTFSDIFDTATVLVPGFTCPKGFRLVNAGERIECLKLRMGMYLAATRLETRRMISYLGGTVEFSKWEGISFDASRMRLYTSMSEIRNGMEDFAQKGVASSASDIASANHIKLPYNECGCVYYMDLDTNYQVTSMWGLVCGRSNPNFKTKTPVTDPTDPAQIALAAAQDIDPDYNNFCDVEGIANPDNIAYLPVHDGLIIGEDTVGGHQNDAAWYMDFRTNQMTRFFSTPYGSEVTSVYYYPDINGFSYIMNVVQHPYSESDQRKINEPENTGAAGYVGYHGPFNPATCSPRLSACNGDSETYHGPYCCQAPSMCSSKDNTCRVPRRIPI